MTHFPELGMKYWDDFERRVDECRSDAVPPLRRLSVHITNTCNLRCSYCNEKHNAKHLDPNLFACAVEDYSRTGGGIVHITGGEPTSHPHLGELLEFAASLPRIKVHLNTNLINISRMPFYLWSRLPRVKVSLDSADPAYFNALVGIPEAFEKVTGNLDNLQYYHGNKCSVSITYTMTAENYQQIPDFIRTYNQRWPNFYAAFFSVYKGTNPRFAFTQTHVDDLFDNVVPILDDIADPETKALFHASHDRTTFGSTSRFPENEHVRCHLQRSELCVDENGDVYNCSHLFRDGTGHTGMNLARHSLIEIFERSKQNQTTPLSPCCLYGCNKKLVTFNKVVENNHAR